MGATPVWKVYDAEGNYQASCKEPEAAAAVVAIYGEGARIKYDHAVVVWREGECGDGWAGNSYDEVAQVVRERVHAYAVKRNAYLTKTRK
jgi:hypothetical protein